MTATVEVTVKVANEKEAKTAASALQKLASNLSPQELEKVANAAANPIKKRMALSYL